MAVRRRLEPARPALPTAEERQAVAARAEARLLATLAETKGVEGHGQEQGDEAMDGAAVNERREALSPLMSRYSGAELTRRLPRVRNKPAKTLVSDIAWLKSAERQPIRADRPFDFSWSENPFSTPEVLTELSEARRARAEAAAGAIAAEPGRPYDASHDGLLCHLALDDAGLRSQVLADTLIQLRAARRTEALMDGALLGAEDGVGDERGGFRSSGVVSAFEQRLACASVPDGDDLAARREYALTRFAVANGTAGAVNGIYKARNAIAVLPDYLGEAAFGDPIDEAAGFHTSIFFAIHTNYSANTPQAVDHYLRHRVFAGGPEANRVDLLRDLVAAARATSAKAAKAELTRLVDEHGVEVPGASARSAEDRADAIVAYIERFGAVEELKTELSTEGKLRAYEILLQTHEAVVMDRPDADDLEANLFYAGPAEDAVAALIHTLRHGDHAAQLETAGAARVALQDAFHASDSAFGRQMLWRLDRQVELLSSELLGTAVKRAEASDEPAALGEALLATRSALRGVLASGLDALRGREKTAPVADLSDLLGRLDALLDKPSVTVDEARGLMTEVFRSATEVADTARGFFHRREGAIRFSDIDVTLDPEFSDSLVKETALHYLLALAQRGMTFGLEAEVSADEIRLGTGVKTLSSVGPRVYERVLVADTPEALEAYEPGPNDLRVIRGGLSQDIVYGGGLVLDAEHAGPGYSHVSVFAKGHGISAIALPELDAAIAAFFDKASEGQAGIYVDDREGSFVIKPLASAIEQGLLTEDEVEGLRPGFNYEVDYFDVGGDGARVKVDTTTLARSVHHDTRKVELLVPDLADTLGLGGPASFETLRDHPLDRVRQAGGEKGAVLVRLAANERLAELGVQVPGGTLVPPSSVMDLLQSAKVGRQTLFDRQQAFLQDPRFADRAHRLGDGDGPGALEKMKAETEAALTKLLLGANGRPTKAGKALLKQMGVSDALGARAPWIIRSSFTGEDRPYKSGAGQYTSVPNCVSPKQRLEGLIGVIASAWNKGAVEANLDAGISLEHVWPSVVVQAQVTPTVSGVAVSRGEKGGFGEVSYQAKPKFGGGVDGGPAEEGTLRANGASVRSAYGEAEGSLLSESQQATLREAILAIEEMFQTEIEPGRQFAVDVEWAFEGDTLHILQARTITGV